ncbi:unnamed protein product, partial [Amoebophrya sp. A25]
VREDVLGSGSYSEVVRVTRTRGSPGAKASSYAMKILSKRQIRERKLEVQLMREVKIQMQASKHRNLTRSCPFEDAASVYLILECADRGHLLQYMRRFPRLQIVPIDAALRFFVHVCLGVQFLHERLRVIHRDLKLENLLLIRLNIERKSKNTSAGAGDDFADPDRRATFCGTEDYLSPEMLLQETHKIGRPVDIWALGVVF